MKPITSGDQEQALPEAIIGEEQLPTRVQARGPLRAFVSLRHRNYRLFFFGQMISQIGTWMQTTAQAWLVLELTHSALLLGLVGVLQYLPMMLFSLFGGVLADRLPKRTLLLVTQSLALVQAAVMWLLVVTGTVQIWHILVLAGLLGITNSAIKQLQSSLSVSMTAMDIHPAIALQPTDIVVTKRRVSAFSGSDLEVVLRAQDISHLVLCGIATSGVVLSTLWEAADKDYQLTILADCCADADEEVQRVLLSKIFPRQAEVVQASAWQASLKV